MKPRSIRRQRRTSAGHGIGVALDVYTQSSIEARRGAAEMLEQSVLSGEKPETAKAEPENARKTAPTRLNGVEWSGRSC